MLRSPSLVAILPSEEHSFPSTPPRCAPVPVSREEAVGGKRNSEREEKKKTMARRREGGGREGETLPTIRSFRPGTSTFPSSLEPGPGLQTSQNIRNESVWNPSSGALKT